MGKMRTAAIPGLLMIAWAMGAMAQNHAPSAVIKVTSGQTITDNRIKVNANEQVCFDGLSSSDSDGNALTYSWDFGDGTAGSASNSPCHRFAANGIYTVRLTVDDGVIDSATKGLLAGWTVSEATNTPTSPSGNTALPDGWTLVAAESFRGGKLNSSGTDIAGGNVIDFVKGHTGSCSVHALMDRDDCRTEWFSGDLGTFNELYASYWEYVDSNATYANSDYYLIEIMKAGGCNGAVQDVVVDAEASLDGGSYTSAPFFIASNGNQHAPCQGYFQWNNGVTLNINAGYWRQYEFYYIPSTIVAASGPINPSPGICASPADSGCGNGVLKMFVDGKLVLKSINANLNGTISMMNSKVGLGGVITSFKAGTGYTRCNPFSSCPGTVPGTGAPTPYNRYIDDVIVLKK